MQSYFTNDEQKKLTIRRAVQKKTKQQVQNILQQRKMTRSNNIKHQVSDLFQAQLQGQSTDDRSIDSLDNIPPSQINQNSSDMNIISVSAEAVNLADEDFNSIDNKSAEAILPKQALVNNDDIDEEKSLRSKSPSPSRFNKNKTIRSSTLYKKVSGKHNDISPSRSSPLKQYSVQWCSPSVESKHQEWSLNRPSIMERF